MSCAYPNFIKSYRPDVATVTVSNQRIFEIQEKNYFVFHYSLLTVQTSKNEFEHAVSIICKYFVCGTVLLDVVVSSLGFSPFETF